MDLNNSPHNPPFKEQLKLFLSVDVEGSTAFKHEQTKGQSDNPQPWFEFFKAFFKDFLIQFVGNCENNKKLLSPCKFDSSQIKRWKNIGDEQIFIVDLTHENQAIFFIKSFLEAVSEYNSEISKTIGLCIKPTAWVAGFPVINAEIQIGSSSANDNRKLLDYIGPSIDIGFRLTKYSTPKKFMLSADLAWVLLNHSECEKLDFFFDALEELKGVFNKKYPLIWVKTNFNPLKTVETLQGSVEKNKCHHGDLKLYLAKFLENAGRPIIKPFIVGGIFGQKPVWYDEDFGKLKKLRKLDSSTSLEQNPPYPSTSSADANKRLGDIMATAKKNRSVKQRSLKKAKKH